MSFDTSDTPEGRARKAARVVANAVNELSFDVEAFADELLREHRTIQQNAFRAFLGAIKLWAGEVAYDLRNEYTVKASLRIVEALGEEDRFYGLNPPHI